MSQQVPTPAKTSSLPATQPTVIPPKSPPPNVPSPAINPTLPVKTPTAPVKQSKPVQKSNPNQTVPSKPAETPKPLITQINPAPSKLGAVAKELIALNDKEKKDGLSDTERRKKEDLSEEWRQLSDQETKTKLSKLAAKEKKIRPKANTESEEESPRTTVHSPASITLYPPAEIPTQTKSANQHRPKHWLYILPQINPLFPPTDIENIDYWNRQEEYARHDSLEPPEDPNWPQQLAGYLKAHSRENNSIKGIYESELRKLLGDPDGLRLIPILESRRYTQIKKDAVEECKPCSPDAGDVDRAGNRRKYLARVEGTNVSEWDQKRDGLTGTLKKNKKPAPAVQHDQEDKTEESEPKKRRMLPLSIAEVLRITDKRYLTWDQALCQPIEEEKDLQFFQCLGIHHIFLKEAITTRYEQIWKIDRDTPLKSDASTQTNSLNDNVIVD